MTHEFGFSPLKENLGDIESLQEVRELTLEETVEVSGGCRREGIDCELDDD